MYNRPYLSRNNNIIAPFLFGVTVEWVPSLGIDNTIVSLL
jgi:hypothetical protein